MAGKSAGSGDVKGGDFVRAFVDLIIIVLLMTGAGFGGYWYGIHERLAPVKGVAPGTPGALPSAAVTPNAGTSQPASTPIATSTGTGSTTPAASSSGGDDSGPAETAPSSKKKKYWVASSGVSWTGYQIIVNVNDNPVDGFTGPGKTVDITPYVKAGDNTVVFQAKELGADYNKHKNDAKAELKVEVVSGPKITDDYKPANVLLKYKRNATEDEDFNDTMTFKTGD